VVTLYLALAAVQFVVAGQLPATGYAVPVQQLVVTVYILLSLIAVESIVVRRGGSGAVCVCVCGGGVWGGGGARGGGEGGGPGSGLCC
jgi:hypothetical protein